MLLAIDTSTSQISLALYDGAQVLAESMWTGKSGHTVPHSGVGATSELAPAVNEMLSRTGVKVEQLKALGVAIGPGSFTSLRVGVSFVKGLALARSLPTIGINTLDVVAASQPTGDLALACLLPSGRGRFALGWYRSTSSSAQPAAEPALETGPFQRKHWTAQGSPQIITVADLSTLIESPSIVCGDLNASDRLILKNNSHIQLISPALSVRRAALLAELAYTRWQAGDVDDAGTLAPFYLHIADPIPADSRVQPE